MGAGVGPGGPAVVGPAVVGAPVTGALVVTAPPSQLTLYGQSQQLQEGLKRRPGWQFMTLAVPKLQWM